MKRMFQFFLLMLLVSALSYGQFHIGGKFTPKLTITNPDSAFFGDIGIRGSWIANDLDKDGKPEIIVTDYTKTGRVHVFQAKNNDTLEWVWSSPRLDLLGGYGAGGSSTPRTVRSGDLDGDGKGEIIFPRVGGGFLIFEWNGVVGSHNFGTKPSAVIPTTVVYGASYGALAGTAVEGGLQLTVEHFEVMDIDKDGQQELLIPKNLSGAANDDFLIISAIGTWEFEDPGFSSFQVEGSTGRQSSLKLGGGSPYAIHPADLDGDGKYEMVTHNWQNASYSVIKATGTDTYVLPDTINPTNDGNQYYHMTPAYDHVALFAGTVADLDNDGNQEVYFPMYDDAGTEPGSLFVVNYKSGDNVLQCDSTHVAKVMTGISRNSLGNPMSSFNAINGLDFDGNGKGEILVASSYPSNVVAAEFQGGNIMDPANYTRKVFYAGESDIYATVTYRDSLGKKDTTRTVGEGFVSKMAGPLDIDKDGKLEILLPYQALTDTMTISWSHFNSDSAKFFTDSTKKVTNPKKWAFRLLERNVAGSVGSHEMVVITPDNYILNQNYPNPFNPTTNISFVLPLDKKISLKIYDMVGKEVRSLISNQDYTKGNHTISWNGKDNSGRSVASGAYIAKMNAGNLEKNIKMMLVK